MTAFFTAEDIHASYGGREILGGVSLEVHSGELVGIIGANGSGKTTLIKAVCGVISHGGGCRLDGDVMENLGARKLARICGYIPQRSGISLDIPALDVVLMGFNPRLRLLGNPDAGMRREAVCALERVGLGGRETENYLFLSEGERQLCILARTLAADVKMMLMDEPESALDFHHRHRMMELMREWLSEKRRCALVALHDPMLALNCCDRLVLLSGGRISDVICPATDGLDRMEDALRTVYGPLSLHRCMDRGGIQRLVMLREQG